MHAVHRPPPAPFDLDADARMPDAARARFADEEDARALTKTRLMLRYAVGLIAIFGVLDAVFLPHLLRPLLAIRAVLVAVTLAALGALRLPAMRHHATAAGLVVALAVGLGIIAMTALDGGGTSPYYAGISFTMLCTAVMLPWPVGVSIACTTTLCAAWLASSLARGVEDGRLFAAHVGFLFSTGAITVLSHRLQARMRRRDFLQRLALEDAGRHREVFFANVTHELKTPLAAILGFLEILDETAPPPPPAHRGLLERVRTNATTLYRLVTDLLDVARADAGEVVVAREAVDLVAIAERVAANVRAVARDAVPVVVERAAGVPAALGDAARVEQVLTNLAANAVRFSGGRAVTLFVRHAELRPAAWQRVVPAGPTDAGAGCVEIAVVDGGPGITAAALAGLFVPFAQAHQRPGDGTGLGLALSAALAGAMRGGIAVRSEPGRGSIFALQLPAAAAGASSRPAAAA